MPTSEWTLANDDYGSRSGPRRRIRMLIGFGLVALLGVAIALSLAGVLPGTAKSYKTSVDCQVNSAGSQGTVTINGTISGDAASYSVTVEVLDAVTHQRIGGQTFEVRGTTTFGGTTPAQAPIGASGIECKIVKVA